MTNNNKYILHCFCQVLQECLFMVARAQLRCRAAAATPATRAAQASDSAAAVAAAVPGGGETAHKKVTHER
eukprot:6211246-Pleurochrysis_carterae.AAC.2